MREHDLIIVSVCTIKTDSKLIKERSAMKGTVIVLVCNSFNDIF